MAKWLQWFMMQWLNIRSQNPTNYESPQLVNCRRFFHCSVNVRTNCLLRTWSSYSVLYSQNHQIKTAIFRFQKLSAENTTNVFWLLWKPCVNYKGLAYEWARRLYSCWVGSEILSCSHISLTPQFHGRVFSLWYSRVRKTTPQICMNVNDFPHWRIFRWYYGKYP